MTRCCCLSSLWCCCKPSPPPLPLSEAKAILIAKAKKQHHTLKQLHIYGVLSLQVLASGILLAVILWLFVRLPEPQVHVTGFAVDGVNATSDIHRTFLHYNITIHNPDLYKSLHYDVLVLRFGYSGLGYYSVAGVTVNFDPDGKGIHQRPGETKLLPNYEVNYAGTGNTNIDWVQKDMLDLKESHTYVILRFVMNVKFMMFGRVISTRQIMRTGYIYFDDYGNAFIDRHSDGLILK